MAIVCLGLVALVRMRGVEKTVAKISRSDAWSAGQSYEQYMGHWSRGVAARFVDWLSAPTNADWLEIGCGTGALTSAILTSCAPRSILATDQSTDFVSHVANAMKEPRVRFERADAGHLPSDDATIDIVTSGLVLNFIPDKTAALAEMQRVLRPGGLLSFYVWDYPGGGMGMIDAFWKAAAELDPGATELDEGGRFPFCAPDGLAELCALAGVSEPDIAPIEIETTFSDFDAFWHPFTLGAGPAPSYCASLPEEQRTCLKMRLAEALGKESNLRLNARAWAVKAKIAS